MLKTNHEIITGDSLSKLKILPDKCANTCVTSPPYFGLRDYETSTWDGGDENCDHIANPQATKIMGNEEFNKNRPSRKETKIKGYYKDICPKCGAKKIDLQIGQEETPEEYVEDLVKIFREVKRVLKDDGTLWLNLGDSYAGSGKGSNAEGVSYPVTLLSKQGTNKGSVVGKTIPQKANKIGLKPKDLIGIPWRVAFALQADGWYLRQDIIWCLSGGTQIYVKTQKGVMPMMIRDLYRLDLSKCELWSGNKWTNILGMNKFERKGDEIEVVLRSGERISCSPNHKFPTNKGIVEAKNLKIGDCLEKCQLPDEGVTPEYINKDLAWFIGMYLAEGSKTHSALQISGHAKEEKRWERIKKMAKYYGGTCFRTINGNKMYIRVYGKVIRAIIDDHISGKIAKNKGISNKCWRYENWFLKSLLDGYLDGDGHYDEKNDRWRLGFTRNYNLERDFRILSTRLNFYMTLNPSFSYIAKINKKYPSFRGEIRFNKSNHFNNKLKTEIKEIRKARCRYIYDLGVKDAPNTFSLASGILTCNSKPNPMPESVKDRCTKAHEYIFLLSKNQKYYYDNEAIKEPIKHPNVKKATFGSMSGTGIKGQQYSGNEYIVPEKRNKRSVWTTATKPYKEAHFAVFPPELIKPCVLAGCPLEGLVLDPFAGSGTTGLVAKDNGRNSVLIELKPEYCELIKKRINSLKQTKLFY